MTVATTQPVVRRFRDQLNGKPLSEKEVHALCLLWKSQRDDTILFVADLQEALKILPAAMTRILNKFCDSRLPLAKRTTGQTDKRRFEISITEHGVSVVESNIDQFFLRAVNSLLNAISFIDEGEVAQQLIPFLCEALSNHPNLRDSMLKAIPDNGGS